MNIREALIQQSPSLALQRAAADEIAKLDRQVQLLQQRDASHREHTIYLAEKLAKIDPTFQSPMVLA